MNWKNVSDVHIDICTTLSMCSGFLWIHGKLNVPIETCCTIDRGKHNECKYTNLKLSWKKG